MWLNSAFDLHCATPDSDPSGSCFTYFGAEGGIEANLFYSIQSGPDGAIWFGTDEGLFRYEPDTFRNYAAADGLPGEAAVDALHATTNEFLWAVSGSNAFVRFDGRGFTTFRHSLPLPRGLRGSGSRSPSRLLCRSRSCCSRHSSGW